MSLTTKRALAESLKKLMAKKRFDKITVKDIVADCGVNRQTFYYHFHDIYDLMEWIFLDAANTLNQKTTDYSRWTAGLEELMRYMQENRLLILNAYHSISHEVVNKYIKECLRPYCQAIVLRQAAELDFSVREEDLQFVTEIVVLSATGLTIEWIEQKMKASDRTMEELKKLEITMNGTVQLMLRNLSGEPAEKAREEKMSGSLPLVQGKK